MRIQTRSYLDNSIAHSLQRKDYRPLRRSPGTLRDDNTSEPTNEPNYWMPP
jgi:hypothetical protein